MSPSQGPVGPPPLQGAVPSLPWNPRAVPALMELAPAVMEASPSRLCLAVAALEQARGRRPLFWTAH